MGEDRLSAIIDKVYLAATHPSGWQDAVDEMLRHMASDSGGIIRQRKTDGAASNWCYRGVDPSAIKAYEEYYGRISPTFRDGLSRAPGFLYTDEMYGDHRGYLRSEIHNDYFAPNSMASLVQTILAVDGDTVTTLIFRRGTQSRPYSFAEQRRFRELAPHVRRAVSLSERLGALDMLAAGLTVALDTVENGVALVDATGRLCFANAAAETILSRRDGLTIQNGRIRAGRTAESGDLARLFAAADTLRLARHEPEPGAAVGGEMAIRRPSGRRDLVVGVAPIGKAVCQSVPAGAVAIVTIVDPEARKAPHQDTLAHLYGLTPSEARLASEVATGDDLDAVAGRLHITRETARTTLKRVFAKTDTHRQPELLRLLLSVPGTVRSEA